MYRSWKTIALGLAALLVAAPACALDDATALTVESRPRGYAASALEAPVAFGGSWGSIGIGFTEERRHGDASMSIAAGLGDPDDSLGFDVAAVISSLSSSDLGEGGFGDEGSFALKLHRNLGDYTAVAIGASAVARWGGSALGANNPAGHYLAITRAIFVGDHVLMLSGGAGHNVTNKNGNDNDIFGSAAFYLTHWLSVITEYDGFEANAAASIAPFSLFLPLTITLGYVDLFEQHNEAPRAVVMASLGFHF